MITQWDIISRIDPKTKIVRYTLVTDGSEADARIVLKKLKGYVSALKKAIRPYIYAFRLPNDLDENTLENIRTAIREVIEQADQVHKFTGASGGANGGLFSEGNTIYITPEKTPEKESLPTERNSIELDLEDATIIAPQRIFGDTDTSNQANSNVVKEQRYEENIKNPSLPVIDMVPPAPQGNLSGDSGSMPVLPENTFVSKGPKDVKADVVPMDATQLDLPDINPEEDQKSLRLSQWFHHKKKKQQDPPKQEKSVNPKEKAKAQQQPAPKAKQNISEQAPKVPFEMESMPENESAAKGNNPVSLVPLDQMDKSTSEQAPRGSNCAEISVTRQEPLVEKQEDAVSAESVKQDQAVVQPDRQVPEAAQAEPVPAKSEKAVGPTAALPAEPADDFPQISVKVRPAIFEEETPSAVAPVTDKPNTPVEQPAKTEVKTSEPAVAQEKQEPAESAVQPQPEQVETQAEQPEVQAAPEVQAEPAVDNEVQTAPEEPAESVTDNEVRAEVILPEEKAEEEQISLHPLNISLEDMFLAETKYDMFVDIDEVQTAASSKASPTGKAQPEPVAKAAPEVTAQPKEQPKAQPKEEPKPMPKTAPEKEPDSQISGKEQSGGAVEQKAAPKATPKSAPVKKVPLPPPPPVVNPQPAQPRKLIKRRTPKDTL